MELETFICEIPLVGSAIGVTLTGKFCTDDGEIIIKLISYLSCIGNRQSINLSDVTDVFPDFRDVNSVIVVIVCQVFRLCAH